MLPEYRNSLHVRYPPVCEKCQPAVDEAIRAKDQMARTKALGGWLKQSKGKEKQRKVSGSNKQGDNLAVELVAWRLRGCLWYATLILSLAGHTSGQVSSQMNRLQTLIFVRCCWIPLTFLSILYSPHATRCRTVVYNVGVLGSNIYDIS